MDDPQVGHGWCNSDQYLAIQGMILLSKEGERIIAYNRATGEQLMLIEEQGTKMQGVVADDNNILCSGPSYWNVKTGVKIRDFEDVLHKGPMLLAYDDVFVVHDRANCVMQYDFNSGKKKAEYKLGEYFYVDPEYSDDSGMTFKGCNVIALAFIGGSLHLVAAGDDFNVHVWNLHDRSKRYELKHAYSVDKMLVFGSYMFSRVGDEDKDMFINMWDLEDGSHVGRFELDEDKCGFEADDWHAHNFAVCPSTSKLYIHCYDGEKIIECDIVTRDVLRVGPVSDVPKVKTFGYEEDYDSQKIFVTSDGNTLVVVFDYRVSVLDLSGKDMVCKWSKFIDDDFVRVDRDDMFDDLLVDELHGHVIVHCRSAAPRLYDLNSGRRLMQYEKSIGLAINNIVIHKNHVYTGSADKRVIKWTLDGEQVMEFVGHKHAVDYLKVYDEFVFTYSSDTSVCILFNHDGSRKAKFLCECYSDAYARAGDYLYMDYDPVYKYTLTGKRVAKFTSSTYIDGSDLIVHEPLNMLIVKETGKIIGYDVDTQERLFKTALGHFRSTGRYEKNNPKMLKVVELRDGPKLLVSVGYGVKQYTLTRQGLTLEREYMVQQKRSGARGGDKFVVSDDNKILYVPGTRKYHNVLAFSLETGTLLKTFGCRTPSYDVSSLDKLQLHGELLMGIHDNALVVYDIDEHESPFGVFHDHIDKINDFAYHKGFVYTASTFIDKRDIRQWRYFGVEAHEDFAEESKLTKFQSYYGNTFAFFQALIALIITFFQLTSFAFAASIPWPEQTDEVRDTFTVSRTLGDPGLTFVGKFIISAVVIVLFILGLLFQEKLEDLKFLYPSNNKWKISWIVASFVINLLAASAFLPVFSVTVAAFDCSKLDNSNNWYLLNSAFNCETANEDNNDCDCSATMREIVKNCNGIKESDFIQCMTFGHYVLCLFAFLFGFLYFVFALRLFRAGGLEGIEFKLNPFDWRDDTPEDPDPEHPLSSGKNGAVHGAAEICVKMLLTVTIVMFANEYLINSFELVIGLFLIYMAVKWPPFYKKRSSSWRGASDWATQWMFFTGLVASILKGQKGGITLGVMFGAFVFAAIGWGVTRYLLRRQADEEKAAAYLDRYQEPEAPSVTKDSSLYSEELSSNYGPTPEQGIEYVEMGNPHIGYKSEQKRTRNKKLDADGNFIFEPKDHYPPKKRGQENEGDSGLSNLE